MANRLTKERTCRFPFCNRLVDSEEDGVLLRLVPGVIFRCCHEHAPLIKTAGAAVEKTAEEGIRLGIRKKFPEVARLLPEISRILERR